MLFRRRKLVRGLACFCLLETLTTLAAPSMSWAMMGPGQPEFTSYESGGSPDLVNLTTGDFTYNIPVLDVPGPERGFSLPLTYRAGIKLEQEASWVGLGWSLNAGAIARSLTGYPDDANGELMKSTYNQKVTRGWTGGVPSVLELGWDVNTGHSGSASLIGLIGLGWSGGGISSGSLVGIHADKGGITANPVEMVAAAVTIATLGTAGSLSAIATSAATQLGTDAATGAAASVLLGRANSGGGALGEPTVQEEKGFLHTNYWVFYNDEKSEFMYGSLNFDQMSQRTRQYPQGADNPSPYVSLGSAGNARAKSPEFDTYASSLGDGTFESSPGADLYLYNTPNADYWHNNTNPLSIAHDDFSVMGGNVSGNIRPYRLEVGSLAFPYRGTNQHRRFATVPYLDDYKVPFRYENSISNGYTYHQYTPTSDATTGIEGSLQAGYADDRTGELLLKDPSLYGSATRTEAARKGILNQAGSSPATQNQRGLVQGKNIKWLTNAEIATGVYNISADGPGDGSFLEVMHPVGKEVQQPGGLKGYTTCDPSDATCQPQPIYGDPTPEWQNNPWRMTLPGKGIGAFAITAEDGTTYHYSLPVYHYTQFSTSYQKQHTDGVEGTGVSTQTIGPKGWDGLGGGFATTWLLTAITSSDYVDRGSLGTVDDQDWGGWVRFDYGKFGSRYKWRQPYLGESYAEDSFNDASYAEGYKETYYLNSVHTRTHTALFLKSLRNDARGHYQAADPNTSHLGMNETLPASSLRLDEIILLTNADWAKLQSLNGIRATTDTGADIPALSLVNPSDGRTLFNPGGATTAFETAELRTDDTYRYVLDKHDVDTDARIRAFLQQQALKRVVFNYSYRLCANTPNSFVSATVPPSLDESQFLCTRTGKLTLESLSIYGPANTKLTPDFKFQYGFNPDYQKDSWDGFGMYKSGGAVPYPANPTTPGIPSPKSYHQVSTDFATASRDASAWSLTGITSPLGGTTTIAYERDQYGSVSEYGNGTYQLTDLGTDGATGTLTGSNELDLTTVFKPGDVIPLKGNTYEKYMVYTTYDPSSYTPNEQEEKRCGTPFSGNYTIKTVTPNAITLTTIPIGANGDCYSGSFNGYSIQATDEGYGGCDATIRVPATKNGGDLRVASLTTQDEDNHAYQVHYDYTISQTPMHNSSGVISKEPVYVVREAHDFDGWFDYPGTGVLYGKVAVIRGLFRNNDPTDYSQREEYTFQTPASTLIKTAKQEKFTHIADGDQGTQFSKGYRDLDAYSNVTSINLGAIGQPLAIKKLNRRGEVESSTSFEYASSLTNPDGLPNQGTYSEGVLTNELLAKDEDGLYFYRINRSTKVYQPTMLVATTTKTNGVSSRAQQDKFDFYTGQVVESSFRNFLGDLYRSKVVPAYTLPTYAAMGPSSQVSTNRNMLTQEAASYVYKVRPDGSQSVVTAGVQTWNGNWSSYRGYDAAADAYGERADDPRPIWRLCESYVWLSTRLNADGTYADGDFVNFNWRRQPLATQAAGWVKAGEFTRYDHYSKPLESKDLNGQYVARKLGYGLTQRVLTAANARYTELAYSGAEDQVDQGSGVLHFGGEVRDGGQRSALYAHTGAYCAKLQPGQRGFTYQAALGREVRGGQKYLLSCWVYQPAGGAEQAQLYAQVDGTDLGVASVASATTKQAGNWSLVTLLVDMPTTGQQLTVGCRHAGGTGALPVYVDDFRFHPLLAPTTAYVYDPQSAQLTYVLDNDNLFTHYEYDAAGKVKRISKEVLTTAGSGAVAERKVKEYDYNFAQMPTPNWLPTGTITWGPGPAGQVRARQREERDINPRSTSFNATRLVSDGSSLSCTTNCPAAGTILSQDLCDSREDPDGRVIYFKYNLVADGRCNSYRDETEIGFTPFCNP